MQVAITLFMVVLSGGAGAATSVSSDGQEAVRQTSTTPFYNFHDMLGNYERGRVSGADNLCPRTLRFNSVTPPNNSSTFAFRLPHITIFAEGSPCSNHSGPFTAEYSFLVNEIFIPGDLRETISSVSVSRALREKFLQPSVIADGSRAFFGFDANAKKCGDFVFPANVLLLFFASKSVVTLPELGFLNAGRKHLVLVIRSGAHITATCAYNAPLPFFNNRPLPHQFLNPTPTPSSTPSLTPTPSITPTSSVTPSPTPTPSRSMSPSPTPTPSRSVSPSPTPTPSRSVSPSPTPTPSRSVSPSPTPTPSTSVSPSAGASRSPSAMPSLSASPSATIPSILTVIASPSPSYSPSSSAAPSPSTQRRPSRCFPASSLVQLQSGRVIAMRDLSLGQSVLVGNGVYSPVFLFTHRIQMGRFIFVEFHVADGRVLYMTPDHVTYSNSARVLARDVRVGDELHDAGGKSVRVIAVGTRAKQGLFNPQTLHGDIVVDGFRSTTFTRTVPIPAAQAALAPLRTLYGLTGGSTKILERGMESLPAFLGAGECRV